MTLSHGPPVEESALLDLRGLLVLLAQRVLRVRLVRQALLVRKVPLVLLGHSPRQPVSR